MCRKVNKKDKVASSIKVTVTKNWTIEEKLSQNI